MEDQDENFFPIEYDYEDVFEKQIYPLIQHIVNICDEYDIPMITSVQFKCDGESAAICTSAILPADKSCDSLREALKHLADPEEKE